MKNANPSIAAPQSTGTTITAISDLSSLRGMAPEATASVAANSKWNIWPKDHMAARTSRAYRAQD